MAEDSGKSRALRIRLDYYKQRDLLYWSRWFAAVVAFIAFGSYSLWVLRSSFVPAANGGWLKQAALQVSTGRIAEVHAHFEHDCQQCHSAVWLEPIAADALKLDAQASIAHVAAACQRCHSVPSHLSSAADTQCRLRDQNCAVCHQDHRGRDADLISVASAHCTLCHANLQETCTGELSVDNRRVEDFSVDSHSLAGTKQFRSLTADLGRIKFDHAQHLTPGQVDLHSRGGFRYDMLAPRWRSTYTADANGLVHMECNDCHQLQNLSGGATGASSGGPRSATEIELAHFYAPIDFEQHCAGCHQMTFAGQTADMLPLPHAASRSEVRRLLSAKLVGGRISGQILSPRDVTSAAPDSSLLLDQVELNVGIERVFAGCNQCHAPQDITDDQIRDRVNDPMIPRTWLQRGMFDHGAHEKITNCQFCHEVTAQNSDSLPGQPPRDHDMVMIKGPESCVPCHRDASVQPKIDLSTEEARATKLGQAQQPNLASTSCVLCHRYHWSRPVEVSHPQAASRLEGNRGE
jgi:hypothetical protein